MELDSYLSEKQKKRKKKRRYVFAFFAFLVVCCLIAGTIWILFRSPVFRVDNFVVKGNETVTTDAVIALLQSSVLRDHNFLKSLLGMRNMLIWPETLSSGDLAFIPPLASITLTKDYWSHTITATVTERKPFAIWCFAEAQEDCYWFDDRGVLFGKSFDTEGSLMVAVHDHSQSDPGLGNKILSDEFVPNFVSIVNVLKASGIQVSDIALTDIGLQEIDVTTYNGPTLNFSLRFPADEDLAVLQSLMAKPSFDTLQYVDFTVENRAYYK